MEIYFLIFRFRFLMFLLRRRDSCDRIWESFMVNFVDSFWFFLNDVWICLRVLVIGIILIFYYFYSNEDTINIWNNDGMNIFYVLF